MVGLEINSIDCKNKQNIKKIENKIGLSQSRCGIAHQHPFCQKLMLYMTFNINFFKIVVKSI